MSKSQFSSNIFFLFSISTRIVAAIVASKLSDWASTTGDAIGAPAEGDGVFSGVLSELFSGLLSEVFSGLLSEVFSEVFCDVFSEVFCGVFGGTSIRCDDEGEVVALNDVSAELAALRLTGLSSAEGMVAFARGLVLIEAVWSCWASRCDVTSRDTSPGCVGGVGGLSRVADIT